MISKKTEKLKQLAGKNFIKNFFSLTVFQGIELLIPLITIPLIISKIGAEKFGLISFALVFTFFFQLIIDFGFNTISIREISIHKHNIKKISKIFYSTIFSKLILSFFCFILFTIIVISFEKFNVNVNIYIFTFISLLGQSLIPVWFFQGLQESKYLIICGFIGRFTYLSLILIFLQSEKNYLLVPIFNSVGYLISSIIAFIIINNKYKLTFSKLTFQNFKEQLKKGKYMFFSEIKIYFISNFNIFLLGILSGNVAVAYFVGAEKIIRAISNLFIPLQNSLFPILSINLNENKKETIKVIKNVLPIVVCCLLFFSILLFIFSKQIIFLILGEQMEKSILVFKILTLLPLLSFLDIFLGKQILLNLNKEKDFFRVVVIIAIINLPLIYFCSKYYSYIGASYVQLFNQFLLTLGMYYYANKQMNFFKYDC